MDYRSLHKLMSDSTQASTLGIDITKMLDMNTNDQQRLFDTVDTSKLPKEDFMKKHSGLTGYAGTAKTDSNPGHTS